ncbi:hypothetical protein PHMEG_00017931 [Phytophthora megakarya]|uniref:Uncharacterized protein n=1 Tax=Phytophthora megakarya TaxID=4795 RepID=A0A225VWL9_9STRA|nr:hypothetical protein PHMEG_00017931 [Phytophthora megakarya]
MSLMAGDLMLSMTSSRADGFDLNSFLDSVQPGAAVPASTACSPPPETISARVEEPASSPEALSHLEVLHGGSPTSYTKVVRARKFPGKLLFSISRQRQRGHIVPFGDSSYRHLRCWLLREHPMPRAFFLGRLAKHDYTVPVDQPANLGHTALIDYTVTMVSVEVGKMLHQNTRS